MDQPGTNGGEIQHRIVRIGQYLKEITTIRDSGGKVLHRSVQSLMLEFLPRDVLQVVVGATILAVPVAFTEEVWRLGATLPLTSVLMFSLMSLSFIAAFVHHNFYGRHFDKHRGEFTKRVVATYLISLLVVGLILTLIQQAPWATDWLVALKRTILVALPASMSAAVADSLK